MVQIILAWITEVMLAMAFFISHMVQIILIFVIGVCIGVFLYIPHGSDNTKAIITLELF